MATTDQTPRPEDAQASDPLPLEVAGQSLQLFVESPPLIAAMIRDIRAARTRVWMESYIFADDAAGTAVAAALVERAQAGLDVRLIVDGWGSFATPNAFFKRLRAGGVRVHLYHAISEAFGKLRMLEVLNQRNHRKLLIVDDDIAYFGGMNIVDQSGIHSTEDAKRRHLPASAGWRDVHVRMVGSQQAEIAVVCERLWRRVLHEHLDPLPPISIDPLLHSTQEDISFFGTRPAFKPYRPQRVFVPLIRAAKREIIVSMAYFVPLGRVLRELNRARKRGVRVRIVVPGSSDVRPVQWAARHFYEYLLKRGYRIYERRELMLHSKALVVDRRWSVIGSCNLDARSLWMNLEFLAVSNSPALARALEEICLEEMRNSVRVTADMCRSRTWTQRTLHRLAWSMRKWL